MKNHHPFDSTFYSAPITSIKKMMGHERIENTMIYARANNSTIDTDMMLVQEKMGHLATTRKL